MARWTAGPLSLLTSLTQIFQVATLKLKPPKCFSKGKKKKKKECKARCQKARSNFKIPRHR